MTFSVVFGQVKYNSVFLLNEMVSIYIIRNKRTTFFHKKNHEKSTRSVIKLKFIFIANLMIYLCGVVCLLFLDGFSNFYLFVKMDKSAFCSVVRNMAKYFDWMKNYNEWVNKWRRIAWATHMVGIQN